MTAPTTISTQDLILLGSIIGGIIAAIQAVIVLGDRLWGKKDKPQTELSELTEVLRLLAERPGQSPFCANQHERLKESLSDVKGALLEQSKSLNALVETLQEQVHADELRHQAVMMKLELNAKAMEAGFKELGAAIHSNRAA